MSDDSNELPQDSRDAVDILQDVDCAKCGSKSLYLVIQQEYRAKACDECGYEERLDD